VETILYVAGTGDTIAEASLFSPTYHCDAVATADAVVRLYPKTTVLREFERDPDAAKSFMAMLADRIMKLRTKLQQRDIRSARDRVRHYLALNVGADGRTVELPGTAKDFAAELGLTHEALYRALADMTADGEIERPRGRIRITGAPPITRLKS
jgi:CRP-like cAMP-binding protein